MRGARGTESAGTDTGGSRGRQEGEADKEKELASCLRTCSNGWDGGACRQTTKACAAYPSVRAAAKRVRLESETWRRAARAHATGNQQRTATAPFFSAGARVGDLICPAEEGMVDLVGHGSMSEEKIVKMKLETMRFANLSLQTSFS